MFAAIFTFPNLVNEKAARTVAFVVAAVAALGFNAHGVADALLGVLIIAAGLESIFALCVGCRIFALLMRTGIIPESVCLECADISARPRTAHSAV